MKINYKSLKQILIKIGKYLSIALIVTSSFFIGKYKGETNIETEVESFKHVYRSDVNIAIDESGNLIILDKESGHYTIFEDSIGNSIFKIYAKNIWTSHNND